MGETLRARDAEPGPVMLFAAVLLAAAGGAAAIASGQFLAWWYLSGLETAVVVAQGVLGVLAIAAARGTWDGRTWGAVLGTVVAPLLAIGGGAWAVWCLANLSISLYLVLAPPLAALAMGLVPFTIPMALRVGRARVLVAEQLRDVGMFARNG